MIITDSGISSRDAALIGEAGPRLLVVDIEAEEPAEAMGAI